MGYFILCGYCNQGFIVYTQNTGDRHQGFSSQEGYSQGSSKFFMKEIAFLNNSGTESAFSLILSCTLGWWGYWIDLHGGLGTVDLCLPFSPSSSISCIVLCDWFRLTGRLVYGVRVLHLHGCDVLFF